MPVSVVKEPIPIPWDRVVPYNLSLVCEFTNPPGMENYFAVVMRIGGKDGIMFPMSRS